MTPDNLGNAGETMSATLAKNPGVTMQGMTIGNDTAAALELRSLKAMLKAVAEDVLRDDLDCQLE
ncbi:MAG: hypothetical protein KGQ52_06415 [Alphaproteobacteria bacterium]|nr:hypothetical protein [Alphaproteobacteria bacterium]